MKSEAMYENGKSMMADEYKKHLGAMYMITSACSNILTHHENESFSWLHPFVNGFEEHVGIITMASELHLNWPIRPKLTHHRSNFEEYERRMSDSVSLARDITCLLDALGYIAEKSLEDFELEEILTETVEVMSASFKFSPPDEDDRSYALKKIYAFKKKYKGVLK